ncbi:hypothetical protein [Parasphingorhabdus sp.]|uniref:hypothetical protein n=1 Tax=Parasphingorhabdus sp. TaxID=2709688 RepID=UPI003A92ABA2
MSSQNIVRIFFWLLLGVILVISTMPAEDAPTVFADDKLNHILAFFILSLMARILWPRVNVVILFVMLMVFGGSIELLQLVMGFGRDADWMDFGADIIAIAMGTLSAHGLNHMRSKIATIE